MTLTVGSLFAGIGGLELGLEMAGGFRTIWQAEQNPYALLVLAKHWPDALRFNDVRLITRTSVSRPDVLTGGFPCQPHSVAGKRASSSDDRDLWSEFARIIGDTRPGWVVAENVPGLLSSRDPAVSRDHPGGFFGRVLRDLASLGYDAEWHSFPAAAVGAPHLRYRVFIVAHAHDAGAHGRRSRAEPGRQPEPSDGGPALADAHRAGLAVWEGLGRHPQPERPAAERIRLPDWAGGTVGRPSPLTEFERPDGREVERDFRGIPHGVSARVHRLERLGNAVVPQCAEVIGRAITEAEAHFARFGVMPDQVVRPCHLVGARA